MSLSRCRWLALPVALALLLPSHPAEAAKKKAQRPAAAQARPAPAAKAETNAQKLQRLYEELNGTDDPAQAAAEAAAYASQPGNGAARRGFSNVGEV